MKLSPRYRRLYNKAVMSLIYFHIFLISAGVLFAFGFGLWEFNHFGNSGSAIDLVTAVGSLIFALFLAGYLLWFVKKKKPQMKFR